MIDLKGNFKGMYINNLECELCNENLLQNQDHLLSCQKIIDNCKELYENINIEHDDIFGDTKKQLKVVRLYQKVLEAREKILEEERDQNN